MGNRQNKNHKMKAAKSLNFNDKNYPGVLEAVNKIAYELDRKPHDVLAFLLPRIYECLPEVLEIVNPQKQAI